jgi:hypothetical protein
MALPLGFLRSPLPPLGYTYQPRDQVQPLHLALGMLVVEFHPPPVGSRSGEHQQPAVGKRSWGFGSMSSWYCAFSWVNQRRPNSSRRTTHRFSKKMVIGGLTAVIG